ncbi:MAG: NAD(P)H-hydrate dehydratase [Acidobacteria bacterium]|nr:NAD(P)H-hydrate dehydratase [Acidobacteriota bacterium]
MLKVLSAQEMREVDRLTTEEYGIPSIVLMENAALAVFRAIRARSDGSVRDRRVLVLCGRGNNGGDGAALARILWKEGADVSVFLIGKVGETNGDARLNLERCVALKGSKRFKFIESAAPEAIDFTGHDCIVDALFGTGLARPIEGIWAELAEKVANSAALRVAVDLPSGLASDSARPIGPHSVVDLTVTFTAPKLANVFPPAIRANGELVSADIGSPRELIDNSPSKIFVSEASDAREWLKKTEFSSDSHKYKRGHALLVVGSRDYAGAAALAGNAAMRSGAGLVTVATTRSAQAAIASKMIEEVITRGFDENESGRLSKTAIDEIEMLSQRASAVALGCGLGVGDDMAYVRSIVENRRTPMIVDAGGLTALSPFALQGSAELPLILTPHDGEFLQMLGTADKSVIEDRFGAARSFATEHNVILLLKGERVLIAAPDGRVVINPTGNPGLGKAGNGDTLAGILAGFVAQAAVFGIDIFETVVAAVYVAGLAGDVAEERFGKRAMTASDVRDVLVDAYRKVEAND